MQLDWVAWHVQELNIQRSTSACLRPLVPITHYLVLGISKNVCSRQGTLTSIYLFFTVTFFSSLDMAQTFELGIQCSQTCVITHDHMRPFFICYSMRISQQLLSGVVGNICGKEKILWIPFCIPNFGRSIIF